MKKLFWVTIVISACSPKTTKTVASAPVASTSNVSIAQVDAAKTKYPDATAEDLKKGDNLYYGTCTNCHEAKTITDFSAEELLDIITRMARKAKIAAEEKDAVLKYVMGVRLAAK